MCNIRGLEYRCGHTAYHFISTCRATFADPHSKSSPRCHPASSLNVLLSDRCMECQYEDFQNYWKDRIAKAEEKRDHLSVLLGKHSPEPKAHGWNSWNSWDGWPDWAGGWSANVTFTEVNAHDYHESPGGATNALESSEIDDETPLTPEDVARMTVEREEAEIEANQLRATFDEEAWVKWEPYLHRQGIDAMARRVYDFNRRRKTSPRIEGGSCLRYVQNAADLPAEEDTMYHIEDDSDSDERSNSMTDSVCSPTTPISNPIEGYGQISNDWAMMGKGMEMNGTWKGLESSADEGSDLEDMLPIWLECH